MAAGLLLIGHTCLSTSNVAIQFGAKPLFEQVTVKFSDRQPLWPDRGERLWQIDAI